MNAPGRFQNQVDSCPAGGFAASFDPVAFTLRDTGRLRKNTIADTEWPRDISQLFDKFPIVALEAGIAAQRVVPGHVRRVTAGGRDSSQRFRN